VSIHFKTDSQNKSILITLLYFPVKKYIYLMETRSCGL